MEVKASSPLINKHATTLTSPAISPHVLASMKRTASMQSIDDGIASVKPSIVTEFRRETPKSVEPILAIFDGSANQSPPGTSHGSGYRSRSPLPIESTHNIGGSVPRSSISKSNGSDDNECGQYEDKGNLKNKFFSLLCTDSDNPSSTSATEDDDTEGVGNVESLDSDGQILTNKSGNITPQVSTTVGLWEEFGGEKPSTDFSNSTAGSTKEFEPTPSSYLQEHVLSSDFEPNKDDAAALLHFATSFSTDTCGMFLVFFLLLGF